MGHHHPAVPVGRARRGGGDAHVQPAIGTTRRRTLVDTPGRRRKPDLQEPSDQAGVRRPHHHLVGAPRRDDRRTGRRCPRCRDTDATEAVRAGLRRRDRRRRHDVGLRSGPRRRLPPGPLADSCPDAAGLPCTRRFGGGDTSRHPAVPQRRSLRRHGEGGPRHLLLIRDPAGPPQPRRSALRDDPLGFRSVGIGARHAHRRMVRAADNRISPPPDRVRDPPAVRDGHQQPSNGLGCRRSVGVVHCGSGHSARQTPTRTAPGRRLAADLRLRDRRARRR